MLRTHLIGSDSVAENESGRSPNTTNCLIKAHPAPRGADRGLTGDKGSGRSLAPAVCALLSPSESSSAPIHMLISPYKY